MNISKLAIRDYIKSFLEEDMGFNGDLTSSHLDAEKVVKAYIEAKEDFILAGKPFFEEVFKVLSDKISFGWTKEDGEEVKNGEKVCYIEGPIISLLTAERTALNLLQHLSGIATKTREYAKILEGTKIKILDTRKTTPGLRYFEKYATFVGGAFNHRFGLYDAVMIKDNHIKAYGGISQAVNRITVNIPVTTSVEVEVENWRQLEELISVSDKISIVMLDNWLTDEIDKAVFFVRENSKNGNLKIEVSGGIGLETLKLLKKKDIDYVSTSKLVTSAKWIDIGMEVE